MRVVCLSLSLSLGSSICAAEEGCSSGGTTTTAQERESERRTQTQTRQHRKAKKKRIRIELAAQKKKQDGKAFGSRLFKYIIKCSVSYMGGYFRLKESQ